MNIFKEIEKQFIEGYIGWDGAKQFEGTGARLARMYSEMCWPSKKIEEELEKCFKAVFEDKYDEMLVSGPTVVHTLCPHHLVPCQFQVYIGYIPKGMVLGLSKFSRVATLIGKRPIMQEQYTREITDAIMSKLQPLGVCIYVIGSHGCMECRGVLQDVKVHTSNIEGVFKTDPSTKEEFFKIIKGG